MHRGGLQETSFMNAVDTNILVYARDPRDLRKHSIAKSLLNSFSDGVLLSSWDALIVAACIEGGVARLYSEDFDAYSQIESLTLINPFKTP